MTYLPNDLFCTVVNIMDGSQFTSGFCAINPNSKIPAAVDLDGPNGESVELFESGSIVLYLAEKYKKFIPADLKLRAQVMNWVFWQVTLNKIVQQTLNSMIQLTFWMA
jgi:GSH-dependent disulfide-bond oxidoreductase